MSAVYRAYDKVMGREVALKRLLPVEETNLNEAAAESLAREAVALSRFQHPNVVTVFAFEEDAEGPYVVMELLEGEDLHAVIQNRALSWNDFRDVAGQCLEPLVAAGEVNLLHRDIKPGNIMLTVTPSGRFLVKLLDFGLAKFSQQPSRQTLDQRGSFLGSIEFIAPEQLELRPLDQRTDLYSLGCVFYYMLARKSPFAGESPAETSMNHVKHRCTPIGELRDDLPPLVADWIMRLISRYPEDRPSDAREALKQFREALDGIPYVAPSLFDDDPDIPFATVLGDPGPSPDEPATLGRSGKEPAPGGKPLFIPAIKTGIKGHSPSGPRRYPVRAAWTRGARREIGPNPPPSEGRPPWGLVASGVGVLAGVALLVWLLLGGRKDEGSGNAAPRSDGRTASAMDFAYPAQLPLSGRGAMVPPLSVQDGLFAHFVSSQGVYGRDYLSVPAVGEPVAVWVNLVSDEVARSLLRDEGDGKGVHLPRYGLYGPAEIAGLRGEHPGVTTTNRSSLAMLRHPGVLPRGFTLVAALRIAAGEERLFHIQPPVEDGRFVALSGDADGKVRAVHRPRSAGTESRIEIPWGDGRFGVLAYVWDPDGRTHRLSSRFLGVGEGGSASGPIEFEGAALGRIAIGSGRFDDPVETDSGNVYFECLVYDRILDASELAAAMDDVERRYSGIQP